MKKMKKFSALIVALVMIFMMGFTALAAGNGSITVSGTTKDKVYDLYRVFDMTRNSDGSKVAYTINSAWEPFFAEGSKGAGYIVDEKSGALNAITVNGAVKYINITDSNVGTFAQDALKFAAGKNAVATKTAEGSTVEFTGLDLGYYLVYPQGATDIKSGNASICSLTSTNLAADVVVKAEYPTIKKADNKVSADVGETVTYTLTGKVPDTTGFENYMYKITDTMSDGLTFDGVNTILVKVNDAVLSEDHYSKEANGNGFVLNIDVMKLQDNVGKEIKVIYTATVNANAVAAVEENNVTLKYNNNPKELTEFTTTPPDIEKVYSTKIIIDKYDAKNDSVKLAGAEFVLQNAEGKYYATASNATIATDAKDQWNVVWKENKDDAANVVTDENGVAEFLGLAVGTYKLIETKAPEGYNLLTEEVSVIIPTAANDEDPTNVELVQTAAVANNSGTLLPGTGGIGTTMFYVIGGILVLVAMVLLVIKGRMKED